MISQVKRISCPGCQAVLDVKNPQGVAIKTIVCPKCQTRMKVTFHDDDALEEAHTFLAGGGEARTMMATPRQKAQQYQLRVGAAVYPLGDGLNTIGRRSSASMATIQIPTTSKVMSRKHARIEVVRFPGGICRVRISNWENKNATKVNGVEIKADDVLLLKVGDTVVMGDVEMTLEVKSE